MSDTYHNDGQPRSAWVALQRMRDGKGNARPVLVDRWFADCEMWVRRVMGVAYYQKHGDRPRKPL